MWEVEYTDEFENWWDTLSETEQIDVAAYVAILERHGPALKFPYSSGVKGSRYLKMRELRIQHTGKPYRILYAFDPRRIAILLIGGNKTGHNRWYKEHIPIADKLYEEHLKILQEEQETHEQTVS